MANKIGTNKSEEARSTKIDIDTQILDGEVTVSPRETTFIETKGEDVADILSNPVYPLAPGEIYTPEEAEAVRNGDLSVEAVVKAHKEEVFDGTEIVEKDSKKEALKSVYDKYAEQNPEKAEAKKEEFAAKLKEAKSDK